MPPKGKQKKPPRASQASPDEDAPPMPLRDAFKQLCSYLAMSRMSPRDTKVVAFQAHLDAIKDGLRLCRQKKELVKPEILSKIVEQLEDGGNEFCQIIEEEVFSVVVETLLQAPPGPNAERGFYLLAASLFRENQDGTTALSVKYEDSDEDTDDDPVLQSRKGLIGKKCLQFLLPYYIDESKQVGMRRMVALLCLQLLNSCDENRKKVELFPEDQRRGIGRLVLCETDEILRTMSARIIVSMSKADVELELLFPEDYEEYVTGFPLASDGESTWWQLFEDFINMFIKEHSEELEIPGPSGTLHFVASVKWHTRHSAEGLFLGDPDRSNYIFVEDDRMTFWNPSTRKYFDHMLAVPLSLVDRFVVDPSYSQIKAQNCYLNIQRDPKQHTFLNGEHVDLVRISLAAPLAAINPLRENVQENHPRMQIDEKPASQGMRMSQVDFRSTVQAVPKLIEDYEDEQASQDTRMSQVDSKPREQSEDSEVAHSPHQNSDGSQSEETATDKENGLVAENVFQPADEVEQDEEPELPNSPKKKLAGKSKFAVDYDIPEEDETAVAHVAKPIDEVTERNSTATPARQSLKVKPKAKAPISLGGAQGATSQGKAKPTVSKDTERVKPKAKATNPKAKKITTPKVKQPIQPTKAKADTAGSKVNKPVPSKAKRPVAPNVKTDTVAPKAKTDTVVPKAKKPVAIMDKKPATTNARKTAAPKAKKPAAVKAKNAEIDSQMSSKPIPSERVTRRSAKIDPESVEEVDSPEVPCADQDEDYVVSDELAIEDIGSLPVERRLRVAHQIDGNNDSVVSPMKPIQIGRGRKSDEDFASNLADIFLEIDVEGLAVESTGERERKASVAPKPDETHAAKLDEDEHLKPEPATRPSRAAKTQERSEAPVVTVSSSSPTPQAILDISATMTAASATATTHLNTRYPEVSGGSQQAESDFEEHEPLPATKKQSRDIPSTKAGKRSLGNTERPEVLSRPMARIQTPENIVADKKITSASPHESLGGELLLAESDKQTKSPEMSKKRKADVEHSEATKKRRPEVPAMVNNRKYQQEDAQNANEPKSRYGKSSKPKTNPTLKAHKSPSPKRAVKDRKSQLVGEGSSPLQRSSRLLAREEVASKPVEDSLIEKSVSFKDPLRKPTVISFNGKGPRNQGLSSASKTSSTPLVVEVPTKPTSLYVTEGNDKKRKRGNMEVEDPESPPAKRQHSSPLQNESSAGEEMLPMNSSPPSPPIRTNRTLVAARQSSQSSRIDKNGSPIAGSDPLDNDHFTKLAERLAAKNDSKRELIRNDIKKSESTQFQQQTRGGRERTLSVTWGAKVELSQKPKARFDSPDKAEPRYVPHKNYGNGRYVEMDTRVVIDDKGPDDPFTGQSQGSSKFLDLLQNGRSKPNENPNEKTTTESKETGVTEEISEQKGLRTLANGHEQGTPQQRKRRAPVAGRKPNARLVDKSPAEMTSGSSYDSGSSRTLRTPLGEKPSNSQAWNLALRPHYANFQQAVHRVADEVLVRLSDEEDRMDLLVKQYHKNGSKIVQSITAKREQDKSKITGTLDKNKQEMLSAYSNAKEFVSGVSEELKENSTSGFKDEWKGKRDALEKAMAKARKICE